MIKTEKVIINSKEYLKTYSDKEYKIQKNNTDEIYDEAIDSLNSQYAYRETDIAKTKIILEQNYEF